MKLLILAIAICLCFGGNTTFVTTGSNSALMIPAITGNTICPGFSIGFSTCSDYNFTAYVGSMTLTDDPDTYTWKRAAFTWGSGESTVTASTWGCWACFSISGPKGTSKGDKGVGACYNGTGTDFTKMAGQFSDYGGVEATGDGKWMGMKDQGYDDSFTAGPFGTNNYAFSTNHGSQSGTLYSLDLNNKGKKSWLGLPLKSKVLLQCYCSKGLTTKPDWAAMDATSATNWATSNTAWVNLEHAADGQNYMAAAIVSFIGALALFF